MKNFTSLQISLLFSAVQRTAVWCKLTEHCEQCFVSIFTEQHIKLFRLAEALLFMDIILRLSNFTCFCTVID
jgi:hypothetical protein